MMPNSPNHTHTARFLDFGVSIHDKEAILLYRPEFTEQFKCHKTREKFYTFTLLHVLLLNF